MIVNRMNLLESLCSSSHFALLKSLYEIGQEIALMFIDYG